MEIQHTKGHLCDPFPLIVLDRIFSYATRKDLRSCRRVCRDWWSEATRELQKLAALPFPSRIYYLHHNMSPIIPPIYELLKFLEIMKKTQLPPVNSFRLTLDSLMNVHPQAIKDFFQLMAPILQELSLDFTRWKKSGDEEKPETLGPCDHHPLKTNLGGIQLKKLRVLKLDFGSIGILKYCTRISFGIFESFVSSTYCQYCPSFLDEDTRTSVISEYFASAPNLQKLIFESSKNSVELVRSLQNSPLPLLRSLILTSTYLCDKELDYLGLALKLKHLSLHIPVIEFKSETMTRFLQSQSKTLEYLELRSNIESPRMNTVFVYEFPKMESLKGLCIIGTATSNHFFLRFARTDWTDCFPKLEEFKMRKSVEEHWSESLFPSDYSGSPHLALKTIDFPRGFETSLLNSLPMIGGIFPNVRTLKMNFESLFKLNIFDWFPNLKKMVVRDALEYSRNIIHTNKFLEHYALELPLDSRVKKLCENLTEFAFEFELREEFIGFEFEPETHHCHRFLTILRERIQVQGVSFEHYGFRK